MPRPRNMIGDWHGLTDIAFDDKTIMNMHNHVLIHTQHRNIVRGFHTYSVQSETQDTGHNVIQKHMVKQMEPFIGYVSDDHVKLVDEYDGGSFTLNFIPGENDVVRVYHSEPGPKGAVAMIGAYKRFPLPETQECPGWPGHCPPIRGTCDGPCAEDAQCHGDPAENICEADGRCSGCPPNDPCCDATVPYDVVDLKGSNDPYNSPKWNQ